MKKTVFRLGFLALSLAFFFSCINKNDEPKISDFGYTLHIDALDNSNAPALQSFAHGAHKGDWLLFAGRTNQSADNGGLHDMTGNYTNTSFPPVSYNDSIFVYNLESDTRIGMSIDDMLSTLKSKYPANYKVAKDYKPVFKNSNSLARQYGDFLYVVGGYGPGDWDPAIPKNPKKQPQFDFESYSHVAKIHVPSLIALVKGDHDDVKADKLFSFGQDSTSLAVTGAELLKIGINFYAVTGHCFGNNCSGFQKYQDAAYPFSLTDSAHVLTVSVGTPISDVSDPTDASADNLSNFRRRDQPIVPAIYKSPANGRIQEGISIYAGVFKAGNDNNLQAWNDAIYIHPQWANGEGRLFTEDRAYDQENYNVYACPSFVLYDSDTDLTQTYLLGGIGDGKYSTNGFLSGFTNTAQRIETNIANQPLTSLNERIDPANLWNKDANNDQPFYGAEAVLFGNSSLAKTAAWYSDANGKWQQETTEIIDLQAIGDGDIEIGYVYGGIEAFEANPASYGPSKSRASKKIFKVTLKKK